jgi:hypothetical protein
LSVNNDLYGYVWRDEQGRLFGNLNPTVDLFPATGLSTGRQLKTHLQRMSGRAVDVVLMLVGFEPDFSGAVDHQIPPVSDMCTILEPRTRPEPRSNTMAEF